MTMSAKEISIAFQTDKAIGDYGPLAAEAERHGFDSVAVYNDLLYQPAWLPLMEMARATSRIGIGVAAVNPFTSHPINIAGNIALVDELSGGRAYLGIARGGWLDYLGLHPQRSVRALEDAMACIRHLLSQSTEPFESELYPIAGGDALRWKILRPDIPFLLGSWGAKTIGATIHQVQEVKIGGSANPDLIPRFRTLIDAARRRASVAEERGIVLGAVSVVDEDGDAARAHARREVALYLPIVAALDPTLELDADLLDRISQAAQEFDFDAVAALVPDALLKRFAFAGTPVEIIDHALELFAAGADRIEFGTPHGLSTARGLDLLGAKVLPALRT